MTEDWDRWRREWSALDPGLPAPPEIRVRIADQEARLRRSRIAQWLLLAALIASVAAALRHSHEPSDLMAAGLVVAAIVLAAGTEVATRRDTPHDLGGTTRDYLRSALRRCHGQLRVAHFALLLAGLELLFFVPWWINGFAVHRANPTAPIVLLGGWLPVAAVLGLLVWAVRARRRLSGERERLRGLAEPLQE